MKNRFSFFIYLGIFGILLGIGEFFMYRQGLPVLSSSWTVSIFVLLPFTFVIPNTIPNKLPPAVSRFLSFLGGYWFIFSYYSLFLLILYALFYGISQLTQQQLVWQQYSDIFAAGGFVLILLTILIGSYNAFHPVYRKIEVLTDKKLLKDITIAFASDIHLGTILGRSYSQRLSKNLNAIRADLVLLGGDIIDGNLEFVLKDKSYENLKSINAPLGKYAVYGNHDYYGENIQKEQEILASCDITFLKDESIIVTDKICITGLDDFLYNPRNKIPVPRNEFFNILVDHEPWRIKEAAKSGYDLYLAGHTHAGQFYPNSLVTRKIYDLDYGSKYFNQMLAVVSNGYGFWGIPVRVGPAPEIVIISIKSTN